MAGIGEGLVSNMNMVEEVIVETVMPGDSFAFPEMIESGVAMEAGGAGEIQLQLVEHPKGRIQVVAGTNGDIIQIVDQTGNHPGVQAVIMAGDMAPKQLQILGNHPGVQAVSMAGDMAPKQLQILGNLPGVQAVSMAGDMAPKQLQILVNKRDPRKTKVKAKLKTKPESVKKNSLAIKISKRPTKTITMKVAATATSIICQFCWREFKKERLYEVHKKTHAKEDEPYVCRYCNSCFEKDSQRNRHMRKKHDYLKCLQCGASFDNKVFFERHMLMHSGQPIMYACKVCGSTFTRKDYLVVHMELHKSEMPAGWDPASILPEDSGAPKKKGTKVKRGTLCCPRCNKTFKTLLLLQKHIAMHKRRFNCHFCPKRFTTRMRRDDHMNVHAENSPYKSQKVLADKSSSSQHKSCQRIRETGEKPDQCAESTVRNHQLPHTEGKIECDVCHRKFARRYDMRKHRLCHGGQEHREAKLVRCDTCGRGFLNASCLREHLRGDRCKAKFQCAFCERHFSRKSVCTVHMKEHMGLSDVASVAEGSQGDSERGSEDRGSEEKEREKTKSESYTCSICGKTLASFKSPTGHYSTHFDKKLFKCDMCDQSYAQRRNLRKHKLSHNASNLACRKCNKVFLDKNALQRHMVMHSYEKKYVHVCDVCDKAFISMAFLSQHKKCHIVRDTRKKPYQCNECERSFLDRKSLRKHLLIHAKGDISRIRKIECEVCQKMFVSSYQMRKHRLSHGGQENKEERLVRCERCGRGFLNAFLLRRHQGHKGCRAKYVCAVCKQYFSRRADLTDHMKEHDAPMDGKWFRCDICDKSYVRKKCLRRHMLSHSGNKEVCLVCNKIFFSKAGLKRHMMTHSGEKPYVCNVCPKAYATKSGYRYHLLMHAGIRSHKCPICDRAFIMKNDLTEHIKMVHKVCAAANKPGAWRCRICDKEINSNAEVVEHKNSHVEAAKRERAYTQDGKPYSCTSCDRSYTKKAFLVRHLVQVHAAEKPFKCDECDNCYAHPLSLRHHKLVHADARPHLCDICGKSFLDGSSLNKHKQTHLDQRMHACQLCDKRYSDKKGLYRHVKMKHTVGGTTSESHPCKICGKVLTSRAGLVLHLRMHTGEKPFECQMCGNAFASKQQLIGHTRTHTGEKPYSCEECGQSFALKSTLRRHAITHTDLRPFVCKICNKAFTDPSTLYNHNRKHTGEKQHQCKDCGKKFWAAYKLKRHKQSHLNRTVFKCHVCNQPIFGQRKLTEHLNVHEKEQQVASKALAATKTEMEHVIENGGSGQPLQETGNLFSIPKMEEFACKVCGKTYSHKKNLVRHQRQTDHGKVFGKEYDRLPATVTEIQHTIEDDGSGQPLQETDNQSSTTKNKQFACKICGRTYSHKKNLLRHQRQTDHRKVSIKEYQALAATMTEIQHTIEDDGSERSLQETGIQSSTQKKEQFACKTCGRTYNHKRNLLRHQRQMNHRKVHKKQHQALAATETEMQHKGNQSSTPRKKRFACKTCKITYSSKRELLKHAKIHLSQRPFQCDICDKSFSRRLLLKEHAASHKRDKRCA